MAVTGHDDGFGLRHHWKCLASVALVTISSFQYGLDFGIIGGLQAMVGFLKVRIARLPSKAPRTWLTELIPIRAA